MKQAIHTSHTLVVVVVVAVVVVVVVVTECQQLTVEVHMMYGSTGAYKTHRICIKDLNSPSPSLYSSRCKPPGHTDTNRPFLTTDVPPLADSVFLELPGLAGSLPLHFHLCADGSRLPGLHVRGCFQTSAAGHPAAHAVAGAAGLPQGRANPGLQDQQLPGVHGGPGAQLQERRSHRHENTL
ncbi:hypothetical protein PAMA_007338 [Pampus argenteus]